MTSEIPMVSEAEMKDALTVYVWPRWSYPVIGPSSHVSDVFKRDDLCRLALADQISPMDLEEFRDAIAAVYCEESEVKGCFTGNTNPYTLCHLSGNPIC